MGETSLREKSLNQILKFLVLYFILDIFFAVYFLKTRDDIVFLEYLEYRIILPNCVNLVFFACITILNKSSKISDITKNRIICISLCLMCGVISICHSYFIALWIMPVISFIFCTMFNDKACSRVLAVLCIVINALCAKQIIHEYPSNKSYYLQNLIVCIIVVLFIFIVTTALQFYNNNMLETKEEMQRNELKYMSQIRHDPLTGIYSRAYLNEIRKNLIKNMKPTDRLVMGMIDIDDFKKINDTYGHEQGDDVLKYYGNVFRMASTEDIMFARFGGEEFLAIFKDMSLEECRDCIDIIRQRCEQKRFDFTDKAITFSCGLACWHSSDNFDDLLKRADAAMYESKLNGKNQITCKV